MVSFCIEKLQAIHLNKEKTRKHRSWRNNNRSFFHAFELRFEWVYSWKTSWSCLNALVCFLSENCEGNFQIWSWFGISCNHKTHYYRSNKNWNCTSAPFEFSCLSITKNIETSNCIWVIILKLETTAQKTRIKSLLLNI